VSSIRLADRGCDRQWGRVLDTSAMPSSTKGEGRIKSIEPHNLPRRYSFLASGVCFGFANRSPMSEQSPRPFEDYLIDYMGLNNGNQYALKHKPELCPGG
jgi:hypothetical protein